MALTFREDIHEYREDGVIVPSITQILECVGITNPQFYTEGAAIRGTHVHTLTEYIDDGVCPAEVDPEYAPYIQAYRLFLHEADVQWRYIEHMVHNKIYGYAGRLDREGILFGNAAIVELKSGGISDWAALQTAAQAAFFKEPKKRYGLQLKTNGKYKLHEYTDRNDIKVFRSAAVVVNWKLKHGGM